MKKIVVCLLPLAALAECDNLEERFVGKQRHKAACCNPGRLQGRKDRDWLVNTECRTRTGIGREPIRRGVISDMVVSWSVAAIVSFVYTDKGYALKKQCVC